MVVLGRRAPAPDPAATPLRMEAVPSRACAADRGGWACGFGRQEVPTGGFLAGPDKPGGAPDWTCGGCRGGGFRGARHSGGFVLLFAAALGGKARARSECRVGGWGAEASPPAACALLPAERGERTDRQTPGPCRAFSFASVGKDAVFVSDGGRHRFIAWARSATEGGLPAAARAGRGGGALAGGGTARGRAPRGARQPDVRGTVACVPRRPPSEPWTPRALPFNVTQREVSS